MIDYRKLYKKIDRKKIISFDIFDTLILRLVNKPSQIFDIVQIAYNKNHSNKIFDFKKNRINSEKSITTHIPSINDIYDVLANIYSKNVCEDLKKLEFDTEYRYCICNSEMKKVYDYCKKNKKKLFAISDMYLPRDFLERILEKNGYRFDNIIVSCENNANKQSSKLFKKIDLTTRKNMLHIGDSFRADYIGAKMALVKSFKIEKKEYSINDNNIESLNILKKQDDNYFYNVGFDLLGPLLTDFSRWLNDSFEKRKINKIYFFSREGKIFKDVFDELYKSNYDTRYLYVSRKTMTIANYKYRNFDGLKETLEYFTIKKDSTVDDFEKYLDIKIDSILEKKNNIYDYINNKELFKEISKTILKKSEEANLITKQYFEQEELYDFFAIVDIGWNGTMQKCMEQFLKNNNVCSNLEGYYFCKFKQFDNSFSYICNNDNCYTSIKDNPVLIENFFQTVDGSTIGYKKTDNRIIPIKKCIEFNEYSIDAIQKMDDGILDFVKNWKKYGFWDNNDRKTITDYLDNYIKNPKIKDIKKYYDFCYSDIKNEYIISRSKNIKKGLISSAWKYGYLKRIFRISLDNQLIIKILKR